jgi:hypothetical protein
MLTALTSTLGQVPLLPSQTPQSKPTSAPVGGPGVAASPTGAGPTFGFWPVLEQMGTIACEVFEWQLLWRLLERPVALVTEGLGKLFNCIGHHVNQLFKAKPSN